jgi:hypothetical protein
MPEGVRRIVTKHNEAGKAIVFSAEEVQLRPGSVLTRAAPWSGAPQRSRRTTPIVISKMTRETLE